MIKFPVYRPKLGELEKQYVAECLDSTWISSKGPFIERFEKAFCSYTGAKHAKTVSNGTVALHVALLSLGIGPGDEVIVPTLTYIASVNAITYTGATPVFVDSVLGTWQINPSEVERKITPKTKAIMAVHLYGQPCDILALQKLAQRYEIRLVEDCAEALGSRVSDVHVGCFGDIATYSFYGNKTVTTGEGGMVTTSNSDLANSVSHLKGQGLAKDREYWHDVIGYNYRMTNICAAIGCAQLESVETTLARKREIAALYKNQLKGTAFELHREAPGTYHSYWMISILLPDAGSRDALREYLLDNGIETRPVFYPIHTMPMYSRPNQTYEVAVEIAARGINLPSFPDLTNDDIVFICDKLKSFYNE